MEQEKLTRKDIESVAFEFYQSNGMTEWYRKETPEEGGNWYGYFMHSSILLYDQEREKLKISVDFTGGQEEGGYDVLFEGHCPDWLTFITILKLVRMK